MNSSMIQQSETEEGRMEEDKIFNFLHSFPILNAFLSTLNFGIVRQALKSSFGNPFMSGSVIYQFDYLNIQLSPGQFQRINFPFH